MRSHNNFYLVDDDNTAGPWDGSFEHPYEKIEDALAAVASGDLIHVAPGTYDDENFPLEMVNGVTLQGESPSNTIIQISDPSNASLIRCIGANNCTVIEGFQFIGGFECILIDDSSPIIQNNIIRDSDATTDVGGGITIRNDANPTIFNNLIINNKIYGILCSGTSAVIMNNTIFGHDYESPWPTEYPHRNGKGIYLHNVVPSSPPLIIKNNIITGNYYGVMKAAQEGSFEVGSYNNVAENIAGNYWEIWPLHPPYTRNFAYSPSPGTGEIHVDPEYAYGTYPTVLNGYYLSQIDSGQSIQSQCVDAGNDSNLPNCAPYYGTTRTDSESDENQIDMGFHYERFSTPEPTSTPTPTGTWSTSTPRPTNTPNPILGIASFDSSQYYTEADQSHASVFDWDRNTNSSSQETLYVTITSTTDTTGITMTLTELDDNNSYFASTITGKNLGFSTIASDDINEIIHVSDGDTITITYNDLNPVQTSYGHSTWNFDPEPPTPTPIPVPGTIGFDSSSYFTESSEAVITVIDPELNTNSWLRETVDIAIRSTTDTTGITVTLYELGTGFDEFSTSPYWTNLTFSTTGSDDINDVIQVTEGDTITATYSDASPPGDRVAIAIWVFASPTPSPTPTATATPLPLPTLSTTGSLILLMAMGLIILMIPFGGLKKHWEKSRTSA